MTTPLFLLRCVQLGISIADLDLLTIGLVNDMFTERQNDDYPYKELASQSDFDRLAILMSLTYNNNKENIYF